MKVFKIKNMSKCIDNNSFVRITDMGDMHEVQYVRYRRDGLGVKKVSKDEYVDENTGEVFKAKHSSDRTGNVDGLRKTFKKLRHLINNNFFGKPNELFITLTYKENMTDVKRLYKDFEKFWKRFKYRYGKNVDYISVVEPQARGAWHCHVLVRFNDLEKVYIKNSELADVWGFGFVTVKRIDKCDNVGAYLTAYLGDIEVCSENEEYIAAELKGGSFEYKNIEVDGKKKKFIKGGRLHLYPTGMNIYRSSRGIKRPATYEMNYQEFRQAAGDAEPIYSECIVLGLEDGFAEDKIIEVNKIVYEHYKCKLDFSQVGFNEYTGEDCPFLNAS